MTALPVLTAPPAPPSRKTEPDPTPDPQDPRFKTLQNARGDATSLRSWVDGNLPMPAHHAQKFLRAGKSGWASATDEDWNDWKWQQRNRVRNMEQLAKAVKPTEDELRAFAASDESFHMGVTPYYASLMDPEDPKCPIRLQSVPQLGELIQLPEDLEDPLGEEADMPVQGITHRYPDRVLFYTTHNCPVYCRHCTRKRKVADPESAADKEQLEAGLKYIEEHTEVRDVVLSGGDPLSLSDERLDYLLGRLRAVKHVEIFRIGTRNLVTLPQRITPELAKLLRKHHPVFVNTHFNHPKECTAEALEACMRLADAGCVLGNQMVLLKGVNDDYRIVKALNQKLLMMRVRPYYIYQCDLSQGISHFRTPVETGLEIMEKLRGHTSGLANPYYVIDAPKGGGKIPVLPTYVQSHEGKHWRLRNYQQREFDYFEP